MFSSIKIKIIFGVYIFLLLSIPLGTYLASKSQNPNAGAKEVNRNITHQQPLPGYVPGLNDIKTLSQPTPLPTTISSPSPEPETNFGPILEFNLSLEGRPANKQSTKLFVGIAEGEITTNPKYILTFSVNLPDNGHYPNLSLAGLTSGNRYSAYLKGESQIASASTFTMVDLTNHLNDGNSLTLPSGDLNDDNQIDNSDLTAAQNSLGQPGGNADINADGLVNSFDLSFIIKNQGKIGAGGVWVSQPPKPAGGFGATIP